MNNKRSYIIAVCFIIIVPAIFIAIMYGPKNQGAPLLFRYSFMANEKLWSMLQSNKRQNRAKTLPVGKAPRVNGRIGLKTEVSAKNYSITVIQEGREKMIPLSSFYLLPKRGYTTEFRCIEGWSEDTQYAGARFSDFLATQNLGKKSDGSYFSYVGLETPDGEYYVSIDMESMLHPQTVLAWERNGKGLTVNTGFPLRLHIPVKYGIKNLKRVGKIVFSDERPHDYWAERGYDWYSGL